MEWLVGLFLLLSLCFVALKFVQYLDKKEQVAKKALSDNEWAVSILQRQRDSEWIDDKAVQCANLMALKQERNQLLDSLIFQETENEGSKVKFNHVKYQ